MEKSRRADQDVGKKVNVENVDNDVTYFRPKSSWKNGAIDTPKWRDCINLGPSVRCAHRVSFLVKTTILIEDFRGCSYPSMIVTSKYNS